MEQKDFFFFFPQSISWGDHTGKLKIFWSQGNEGQVLVLSVVGTITCRLREKYKYFSLHISSLPVRLSHSRAWHVPVLVSSMCCGSPSVCDPSTNSHRDRPVSAANCSPPPWQPCSDCILSPSLGKSRGGGLGGAEWGRAWKGQGGIHILPPHLQFYAWLHRWEVVPPCLGSVTVAKASPCFPWERGSGKVSHREMLAGEILCSPVGSGGWIRTPPGGGWGGAELSVPLPWQGIPLELLRGAAPAGSHLDVCSPGHHRPALGAFPDPFCRLRLPGGVCHRHGALHPQEGGEREESLCIT